MHLRCLPLASLIFRPGTRLLLAALLVLVIGAALAPAAGAKGKKVTCKAGKVPVTVGKKTTCVPLGKAFPKPKASDVRLAYLQEALKPNGAKPASKRAHKKLLEALPKVIALLDRQAGGKASALRAERRAGSGSGCSPSGAIQDIGSFQGVGISAVGENGGQMVLDAGGLTYKVRFASCGGGGISVPECPAANGDVDGSGRSSIEVTDEVLDGARVVSRRNISVATKSKAHGKVAADAKLDYIVVGSSQETFIVASGGIVLRGTSEREVKVNMRSGAYDSAGARVRYSGDAKPDEGAKSFSRLVKDAIDSFHVGEVGGSFLRDDGWATFNRKRGPYCAKAVFSPDSNTLKLSKGKAGQILIYAKGQDGGRATGARWTLLNPENASFTPTSSQDAGPAISYTVTNAPANGFVKVKAKFTSTAGVGEDTWTQPTDKGPTINKIAGPFSLRSTLQGSVLEWAGNVSFERFTPAFAGGASGLFRFKEGQITVTASGNGTFLSAPLCSQRGSTQIPFSSGSSLSVLGSGPEQLAPYEYSFSLASNNQPLPMLKIEIFNCDPVAKAQEGFYDWPVSFALGPPGLQTSPDGLSYAGSETVEQPGFSNAGTWSFQGTE